MPARLPARSLLQPLVQSRRGLATGLSAHARTAAERISDNWKGTSATGANTKNFIGGEFVESKATKWIDVHDPVRLLCWIRG